MAKIVELREMSDDKLDELLENAREEMFNLRFQKASARLENYARLKHVRREIAQVETVLHMRSLARDVAASEPHIAAALAEDGAWQANVRFVYEDSAWEIQFVDGSGSAIASAVVDLNKKQTFAKRDRAMMQPGGNLVVSYEVAG